MATASKRATVFLDANPHRALRLKAAETERSMSDLVNEAVKPALVRAGVVFEDGRPVERNDSDQKEAA